MGAFAVFDPQNNLIFESCDKKFGEHLKEFAFRNGLMCEQTNIDSEQEYNLLSLLLIPYVTAQRFSVEQINYDCIPNTRAVYAIVNYLSFDYVLHLRNCLL